MTHPGGRSVGAGTGNVTQRDVFMETYQRIAADGRPVLVFTEAADTMEYLRDWLFAWLGRGLATYSGRGGER